MADLFGYRGVTPPMVFGQPTDAMGSALYNSGLLRQYTPLDTLQPNPWTDPNASKDEASGGGRSVPSNPNNAMDPNSYWRPEPGSLGANPTWQFIPGLGIIPVAAIGEIPKKPSTPPISRGAGGMGAGEQFMLGMILGMMAGSQGSGMMNRPGSGMPINSGLRPPMTPPPSGAFQDAKMPTSAGGGEMKARM